MIGKHLDIKFLLDRVKHARRPEQLRVPSDHVQGSRAHSEKIKQVWVLRKANLLRLFRIVRLGVYINNTFLNPMMRLNLRWLC